MLTYSATIEQDEFGEFVLEIPQEILSELDWTTGDALCWTNNGDGTWTLSKS